jgi:hypothetical protein
VSKKLTTSEFIERARDVHGDKYGYALVVYISTRKRVKIHCRDHGMFEQTPYCHLTGQGCISCAGKKKHDNESFIEKAREVHGDRYDYSHVDYTGNKNKISIGCPKHDYFEQKPNQHLNGQGCPTCSIENKTLGKELFIQKAREIHGENNYDYSLVDYVSNRIKVVVKCQTHGVFTQTPTAHLQGNGCPGCTKTGFDRTKFASLYILRSDCGRYMKIGITHKPDQRHTKLKRETPFSFKRIELIEGPGCRIADLEKELLSFYQQAKFIEPFDGYTEWCLWDTSIIEKLTEVV